MSLCGGFLVGMLQENDFGEEMGERLGTLILCMLCVCKYSFGGFDGSLAGKLRRWHWVLGAYGIDLGTGL